MKKFLSLIAITITLFGCQSNNNNVSDEALAIENKVALDSTTTADQAVVSKIIKTADMRFRTKDVQDTKAKLSAVIKQQGGTVAEFVVESRVLDTEKIRYSLDSLNEVTSYQKEGSIVAKIPSENIDDFTNTVAKLAIFVDQQSMKMDDQSIAYLSNMLKAKNRENALKAVRQPTSKKQVGIKTSLDIGDEQIDRKTENMDIDQRVKYSTVTLSFYQDKTIHQVMVGNDRLADYGPGFLKRVGLNIVSGWSFFKEILLGIVTVWPFLAIGLLVYFVLRPIMKRKKKLVM